MMSYEDGVTITLDLKPLVMCLIYASYQVAGYSEETHKDLLNRAKDATDYIYEKCESDKCQE